VPNGHVNGILLGYVLKYNLVTWKDDDVIDNQKEEEKVVGPNDYSTSLEGLVVDGVYAVKIAAFTVKGVGTFSEETRGSK